MLFGDGTDAEEDDEDNIIENRNDRMENFGNQVRGHLNHNKTIYAEERDVFNKKYS